MTWVEKVFESGLPNHWDIAGQNYLVESVHRQKIKNMLKDVPNEAMYVVSPHEISKEIFIYMLIHFSAFNAGGVMVFLLEVFFRFRARASVVTITTIP